MMRVRIRDSMTNNGEPLKLEDPTFPPFLVGPIGSFFPETLNPNAPVFI